MITMTQLEQIMPHGARERRLTQFINPLNDSMFEYGIDTPARQAAFLAQLAHESGEFRYVREIADGSAYEGRRDLGNTQPGDGRRFRGRGLIQLTGRANYAKLAKAWGIDLVAKPELLETPVYAARSAAWFWHVNGLNAIADSGNFTLLTRRINGGLNGYADRCRYWEAAKKALMSEEAPQPQSLVGSQTAWITGGTAVVTGGSVVGDAMSIADTVQTAASAGYSATGAIGAIKAVLGSTALPWLLLLVVAGVSAYVWWRYRSKVRNGTATVT